MHTAGFEPAIRVIDRRQIYTLDRASNKGSTLPPELTSLLNKHGGYVY